jgi:hypothetical protein
MVVLSAMMVYIRRITGYLFPEDGAKPIPDGKDKPSRGVFRYLTGTESDEGYSLELVSPQRLDYPTNFSGF